MILSNLELGDNEYPALFNKSFVNNVKTIDGGTHEVGLKSALTKVFNDYAKNHNILKDKDSNLQGEDIREGITAIVSVKVKDPQFGQTVMFGLGGIFVELLKHVSFRVAPLTKEDAKEMIINLKAFPLLNGYRGSKPADLNALADVLCNVSKMILDNPEIKELDLNPVMAYPVGSKCVDARIILE